MLRSGSKQLLSVLRAQAPSLGQQLGSQGASTSCCAGSSLVASTIAVVASSSSAPNGLRALPLLLQTQFFSHPSASTGLRTFTSTAHQRQSQQTQHKAAGDKKGSEYDSLEITQERINAITDKIPQRPVGVVEGTSYTLLILAAFGVLAFVLWQFVVNFILEPTAMQCFNHTLALLKGDPRITVRLGAADDIRAWGSNSSSRVARQQVPHQIYKDANGVEHVRIQFYMKGGSGTGLVNADMYRDATTGNWQYTYLLVDVYSGSSNNPSRVYIKRPE